MPRTTRSTTQLRRATPELDRDRELEALEAGVAPGLPGDEAGEFVERAGCARHGAEIGGGSPVLEP